MNWTRTLATGSLSRTGSVRRTGERIALALQKRSWVTLGSAGREFLAGVAISPGAVFLSGAKDKVVSGHGGEACAAPFNCRLSRPSLIPAKAIGPRVCEPRPNGLGGDEVFKVCAG